MTISYPNLFLYVVLSSSLILSARAFAQFDNRFEGAP
jgi:hypothetical protein